MNEIERAIEQLDIQIKCRVNTTSIKTCKMAISALERQIPKKPIRVSNNRTDGCPKCKTEYYEKFKYCPECGIKLDWSVWKNERL